MNINGWGRAGLSLLIWQALCWGHACGNPQASQAREFGGVIPKFEILPPIISVSQPLEVRVTLRNISNSAVQFRYFAGQTFIHHMSVCDKNGRKVISSRLNTHSGELAATTIRFEPHQSLVRTQSVDLSEFYDLAPGEYYVQFHYDLRLIEDDRLADKYMKRYHSRDVVPWSTERLRFAVRSK